MKHIKITDKQLRNLINEVIGYTSSYESEAEHQLKQFVEVVKGPITKLVKDKSLHTDNVVTQRIYQLITEGGELHALTQELIDLLESLPDKPSHSGRIGFRIKSERKD